MASEQDFNWEDDLMTKSFQRQESHLSRLSQTHGKDYGKPQPGSESEKRSLAYQKNVMEEVVNLCYQISQHGYRTAGGTEQIQFGELFRLNEKISNKCVGILQRARKHRLLHFAGETLWQGPDDSVTISLMRKNREIQVYFDQTKQLLPNSPSGNLWIDVDTERRCHYTWVTSVRQVSPTTVSYHVQVNYAEFDDNQELPKECHPLNPGEERSQATVLVEPHVIFKHLTPTQKSAPLLLSWPLEYFISCLPGEVEEMDHLDYQFTKTAKTDNHVNLKAPCQEVISKKCPQVKKESSPVELPPRIRVHIHPSLDLSPVRKPKCHPPKQRKMKIKFSACTVLYKPARPVYEKYKELSRTKIGMERRFSEDFPVFTRSEEDSRIRRRQSFF